MINELLNLSAVEIGKRIKSGEISVCEVTEFYLDRAEKYNPELNCFNLICRDYALKRADEVQRDIDSGKLCGTLAGIPVAVKDNICTKGIPTACSSKMLEGFIPPYNATVIDRINAEGLIVIGKLNMDEFAMGSTNETSVNGAVLNPWDKEKVPGGSSGGAAAAVGAGLVPLALASDTGGSIRQPCSFCSCTGIKPTYGAVSRYGLIAYASSLDTVGAIARNADDCRELFSIIRGYDEKDSTSKICEIKQTFELNGKKIGIPENYFGEGLADGVKNAVLKAAETFKKLGADIEYFSMPELDCAVAAYYVLACAEASSNLARYDGIRFGHSSEKAAELSGQYLLSRSEGFSFEVKKRIMLGNFVLSSGYYESYYKNALKAKAYIKRAMDEKLEEFDFILSPVSGGTAPKLGESLKEPLKMYLNDIYTVPVNLAGLPAAAVPCGFDEDGMPVGCQLIGRAFCEDELLCAAKRFEEATDYHLKKPSAFDEV